MNIIRLLLIGGLVYFAMQQKKEGTRNMILIVTGLLAVCMLSKEGFTVDLNTVTCTGNVTTQAEILAVEESCVAINAGDAAICADVRLPSDQGECESAGGGSKCMYTAAVTGQPAQTRPCDTQDLTEDETACQNGCALSGGDTIENYFTSDSMTSLGLNYVGDGTVDITTPQDLANQFTCSNGNTLTVKDDPPPGVLTQPVNLSLYLQCSAPPRPSPTPTPTPATPTQSASPSSYGGCRPSEDNGKSDSCGDFFDDWSHWEWRRDSKSPDPNKLCSRNDVLPNVYCM